MIYRWEIRHDATGIFKYEAELFKSQDGVSFKKVGNRYHVMLAETLWGMKWKIRRAIRNDRAAFKACGEKRYV